MIKPSRNSSCCDCHHCHYKALGLNLTFLAVLSRFVSILESAPCITTLPITHHRGPRQAGAHPSGQECVSMLQLTCTKGSDSISRPSSLSFPLLPVFAPFSFRVRSCMRMFQFSCSNPQFGKPRTTRHLFCCSRRRPSTRVLTGLVWVTRHL